MRIPLATISAAVLLTFYPTSANAQGLSVGPITSQRECDDFCTNMVFDCDRGVHHPVTNMCTVFTHRPPFYSGIALSNLSDQECKDIETATGANWDMQGEWCVEVPPDPPQVPLAGAPDLTRILSSQHGCIHLTRNGNSYEGWYGVRTNTLRGTLSHQGGAWVFEGDWGRTNSNNAGGFEWTFNGPMSWTGNWWYAATPNARGNTWNSAGGTCTS